MDRAGFIICIALFVLAIILQQAGAVSGKNRINSIQFIKTNNIVYYLLSASYM